MAAIRLRRRTAVIAVVALLGVPVVLLTAAWVTLAAGDTGTVSPSARSSAETVGAALRGIRLAIGPGPVRRPFGVALYADYSATSSDWNTYAANRDP